ncbi:MAG: lycopene cyclase domain-containing protein [Candidatus Omnitrophica bacterium]|nr:lycopene cyclase domain-containing protein [Candidatus Omnitrophota bacterium]
MSISTYLLLNLIIIIFPLAFSFEKRISYYRKWPALFLTILFVGGAFVIWDMIATHLGHWSFNPKYVGTLRLAGLPVEEILFFVTVPYSCLFIYEVICFLKKDDPAVNNRVVNITLNLFFWFLIAGIFLFSGKVYTLVSLFAAAAFLVAAQRIDQKVTYTRSFWIFMAIGFILFMVFNGILTGLPVVEYSPRAIIGWRIFHIPIEDFFYNFSFLGFCVLIYNYFKKANCL